ncbi:MAG TPA: hypothetical protein VJ249_11680 [Candidatus Bathyarchaeia archaeon]|nr:hypothetical protein [Candidatus Bathyarchaeia archaeon]
MKQRGTVRERIIRVLLNEPTGALTMYRVAKEAECTFPWVHEFLQKLQTKGLVEKTTVKDYEGLIKYWLEVKTKPEKIEYMHKDPLNLLRTIKLPYALTTYRAENLVQHLLFPSRTDLYIRREDEDLWHRLIRQEGLVGKGNLRLLIADSHVFYRSLERRELKIVSPPQLIVDLLEEGGVCTEAAQELLEKVAMNIVRIS